MPHGDVPEADQLEQEETLAQPEPEPASLPADASDGVLGQRQPSAGDDDYRGDG